MSDQHNYATLGVGENASFEEIKAAKERLLAEHQADRKQVEAIEAAYDAILMDRLRLRQEGKIKVPDRIRFPERTVEPAPNATPASPKQAPSWLQRLIDTPSQADVLMPAGVFTVLSFLSFVLVPSLTLAFGVGFSLYFLNRKENKFGRAVLLTLAGLIVGVLIGLQLGQVLAALLNAPGASVEAFASLFTFFLLWLITSFLR